MRQVRLGLIGDNIRHSRSPLLHRLAGELCGLDVTYDLLVPAEQGLQFDALFDRSRESGYRGLNVTYPYKERAAARVQVDDPAVRRLGACNTVLFGDVLTGDNTDYTGFRSAFRETFGDRAPGRVAMAGAGGVGKAIAFALADLGATAVTVFDPDHAKAERLAAALAGAAPALEARAAPSIAGAMEGAEGLVNCTPLGMNGHPGSALPAALMPRRGWAFDAVYTPVGTEFLAAARSCGLDVMSGYELFFHQGLHAFRLFAGTAPDSDALRAALLRDPDAAPAPGGARLGRSAP